MRNVERRCKTPKVCDVFSSLDFLDVFYLFSRLLEKKNPIRVAINAPVLAMRHAALLMHRGFESLTAGITDQRIPEELDQRRAYGTEGARRTTG